MPVCACMYVHKNMCMHVYVCAIVHKELEQRETLVDRIRKRRLPAEALYCHTEGTWSQGRQTKKWMDNVRQDLTQKDMDMRMP